MKYYCVLKSGGDYTPADVSRLADRLEKHAPGAELVCLTDFDDVRASMIKLEYDWPGWWSKMELFKPSIAGTVRYLDLDTVPIGDLSDLGKIRKLAIMRDVYRPDGLQSAVMVIPRSARAQIWKAFIADPAANMAACSVRYSKWGDQGFLETFWRQKAARLQDLMPGQIVSYKVDCRPTVPAGARLVVFHGKPRPAEVGW